MPQKIKYPVINGRKECGSCGEMLPLDQYDKARRHYTSACKSCRKAYAAEYRQRPDVKRAMLAYSRQYRGDPGNRKRLNENSRKHRRKPEAKIKRNAARRAWSAQEKQKAVTYKGGKCICCGYSDCLAAMDFHHPDPAQKEGYGKGSALRAHWSFENNKPELDKCVLVCVRCHREIHAGHRAL